MRNAMCWINFKMHDPNAIDDNTWIIIFGIFSFSLCVISNNSELVNQLKSYVVQMIFTKIHKRKYKSTLLLFGNLSENYGLTYIRTCTYNIPWNYSTELILMDRYPAVHVWSNNNFIDSHLYVPHFMRSFYKRYFS